MAIGFDYYDKQDGNSIEKAFNRADQHMYAEKAGQKKIKKAPSQDGGAFPYVTEKRRDVAVFK